MAPPRVIVVEGEIAAGKTELVRALAAGLARRGLRAVPVYEPVEEWRRAGLLDAFYRDPARWAYTFQTYVFATRVLAIRAAAAANPDADVLVLERSPATDPLFMALAAAAGHVTAQEHAAYRAWCEAYGAMLPLDLSAARVLYLAPELGTCMRRLAARGRGEETGVSADYQARLRRAHLQYLFGEADANADADANANADALALPPSPFRDPVRVPAWIAEADFRTREEPVDALIALALS
jgi:deoxyadenosine/deoxycytidine kinase